MKRSQDRSTRCLICHRTVCSGHMSIPLAQAIRDISVRPEAYHGPVAPRVFFHINSAK